MLGDREPRPCELALCPCSALPTIRVGLSISGGGGCTGHVAPSKQTAPGLRLRCRDRLVSLQSGVAGLHLLARPSQSGLKRQGDGVQQHEGALLEKSPTELHRALRWHQQG